MPTDDKDDDRPARRPRRDDDEDDRPARKPKNSRDDEDGDDDRPARRPRRDDDDDDRPRRRSDKGAGLGIASLVIGIISIPCCIGSLFSLPVSILAIILGFVSRSQGGPRGTATAGIICGFVSVFLVAVVFILAQSGAIDPNQFKQFQQK